MSEISKTITLLQKHVKELEAKAEPKKTAGPSEFYQQMEDLVGPIREKFQPVAVHCYLSIDLMRDWDLNNNSEMFSVKMYVFGNMKDESLRKKRKGSDFFESIYFSEKQWLTNRNLDRLMAKIDRYMEWVDQQVKSKEGWSDEGRYKN